MVQYIAMLRIHDILVWIRIRGSMPLTNGSCYFRLWPLRCQQKNNFLAIFSAYYFLKVHLHHFSKIKSLKESQNSRNQGFSYYFFMMIEGSGSIPTTNGSGSGRAKNMWIRIRIRIRSRNTGILFVIFFWLTSSLYLLLNWAPPPRGVMCACEWVSG